MTEAYLFDPPAVPSVAITDRPEQFPLRRIFCVGRNYAAHAAEMGNEVDREAPFYFTKSAHAFCPSGSEIAYPPGTQDCHYEMEFVVALGAELFGVAGDAVMEAVWGYGSGIDLTRRDLQGQAKEKRRPWDLGKDFENAAILGALTPRAAFGEIGEQRITLEMDGRTVQDAHLSDMVWSVPEILAHLSQYYRLMPGDVIMTGTPAGVGPVTPGAKLTGRIDGLAPVELAIKRG
ncbi:fumarylacetoacetate hydrolase family protein [Roseovarius sp. SCSIO 43702]|uniref:fumarylacetoacetate hydrolase family protein n=1 Tax=Roseovarius sp. SCSIO 43702 TaxID=2823043 RepID=UPI001C739CE7|nr:fumarylacetoacetate hydrolase family protein [Roseovarius sp. SCSIO 43702]QYX58258.1 fumarylacetoacetate hydrolase family protein [Roseovarius sp. SCSIO 43702]